MCVMYSINCKRENSCFEHRLTLEQKELCRSRLKLLTYLDRLETYEVRNVVTDYSASEF